VIGQLLGWRNPRPNDFQSADLRPLRDLFGNLQQFMTWPHVGLRFDGSFSLNGTLAPIPFTVKSSAASPFVPGDPYSLYRSATKQVQVPQDFDTWLALGVTGMTISGSAGTPLRTFGWRVNAATSVWLNQNQRAAAGGLTHTVPFMSPVRKGDTLEVAAASSDVNDNVTAAEAWVFFLPLA